LTGTTSLAGTITANAPSASTSSTLNYDPAVNYAPVDGDNGTAQASAQTVTIVSGSTVIKADGLSAQAAVTCQLGNFVLSGSASVGALSINGNPVTLTGGPQDIPTPAGTLHVDAAYAPLTVARYQRALWLQTSSGDIIAAEAAVAGVDAPCTNGAPPPPPPPGFGCWGSAIQYTVIGNAGRPFVANPNIGPCVDRHASAVNFGFASDFVAIKAPYADTSAANPDPLPTTTPYPDGASASATAGAASVQIGTGDSAIRANALSATATSTCSNRTFKFSGDSHVGGLRVGGVPIPDSTGPTDIKVLGGTLHVNWSGGASNYTERRALWLESTLGEDIVVGDVISGVNTNPC
jgi:hypothetical protein